MKKKILPKRIQAQLFLAGWAMMTASVLTLIITFFTADVQPSFFDSSIATPTAFLTEPKQLGAQDQRYEVLKVIDGDTIRVKTSTGDVSVRLIGLDAPEMNAAGGAECFAKESKARLEELIALQQVRLVADESQQDVDRYGRLLRYVYDADGTFINKLMIQEGVAYEYTYAKRYAFAAEFMQAQRESQQHNTGLWNVCAVKK